MPYKRLMKLDEGFLFIVIVASVVWIFFTYLILLQFL